VSARRGTLIDRERLGLEVRRAARPFVALVLLAVAAIACTGVILKNIGVRMPWANTYSARIAVDDVKGLVTKKHTVRMSGVEIGRVEGISLAGTQPIVKITIDGKYGPLYRDARVRIRPETPLDDMSVNIESRGHASAGVLGSHDVLQADRTQTPVDIGRVLDVFNADTRDRVAAAIAGYGRGLADHGQDLRAALVQLAPFLGAAKRLTRETAVRQVQTRRLVHNLRLMTSELAARDRDVRGVVGAGAASLSALADNEASVQALLTQLPPTLAELRSSFATVRATATHLDPALDALRPVAAKLPAGLQALQRFSVQARPSLASLRRPLPKLDALMRSLRPTTTQLDHAFAQLSPQAPRLDRVTAKIVPCEDALAKFFQNTVSLTKFYDFHGDIVRGQVVSGTNSVAGLMQDPNASAAKSCAAGGPTR
jgi:virulence factor Mce-like protein